METFFFTRKKLPLLLAFSIWRGMSNGTAM